MSSARRLVLATLLLALPTLACAQDPVRHEFVLKNFKTESGVVLPEAHLVYGTYGTLNAAHSNAILLPSHYMAELHGYGFLIKTDKAPLQRSTPPKTSSSLRSCLAMAVLPPPATPPSPFMARAFPS